MLFPCVSLSRMFTTLSAGFPGSIKTASHERKIRKLKAAVSSSQRNIKTKADDQKSMKMIMSRRTSKQQRCEAFLLRFIHLKKIVIKNNLIEKQHTTL